MRKELTSKNKRKWIVGGILFFSGVALLTTGFATWVVGINRTQQSGDNHVEVMGTKNEMFKLDIINDATTDYNVKLAEKVKTSGTYDNEIVQIEGEEEEDLKIKLGFTIEVGSSTKVVPDKIKIEFNYSDKAAEGTEPTEAMKNTDANKVTSEKRNYRDAGQYTYIDLALLEITIPDATSSEVVPGWTITQKGTSTVYSYLSEIKIFNWGTFFNNKTPYDFYNSLYNNPETGEGQSGHQVLEDDVSNIVNELDDLKKAFYPYKEGSETESVFKPISLLLTCTTKDRA